jgi:hypothetical protein
LRHGKEVSVAKRFHVNGVDGLTGRYMLPEFDIDELVALIKERPPTDDERAARSAHVSWIRRVWRTISQPHFGLPLGLKPESVADCGWAVVFHSKTDTETREALAPLISHRRRQIGDAKVKELEYVDGETRDMWLARHGVASGSVVPPQIPCYLLFVGSPADIPFSFLHEIDVEYCVGLLHFDTAAEYAQYVASVIEYESAQSAPNRREVAYFAPRHDEATELSADMLVAGLTRGTPERGPVPAVPPIAATWKYAQRDCIGDAATKSALSELLRGVDGRPLSLLFTAGHGVGWPAGHSDQLTHQGALLCQDWPGAGSIASSHYLTAADVPDDAHVHGLVSFHFACYGAGTPQQDRFFHEPGRAPEQVARKSFVAALPKRLLAHPRGGALGCIGHVERAWGCSFASTTGAAQLLPFQNAIGRLLIGQPVGYALKDINERYAALSTSLANLLEQVGFGGRVDDEVLASTWVERNDAEGYLLIGDPAVALRQDLSR